MTYESKERQWFALSSSGNMCALGDCGNYDAAEEIANDLEIDVIWLANYETAKQWHDTISKLANYETAKQWHDTITATQEKELI